VDIGIGKEQVKEKAREKGGVMKRRKMQRKRRGNGKMVWDGGE
jgi:hypothetical protein